MRIIIVLFLSIWSLNLVNGQDIVLPEVAKYKGWSPLSVDFDTMANFDDHDKMLAQIRKAKTKLDKVKALNKIAEEHNNGPTANTDSSRFYYKKVFLEISEADREQDKELNRQYLLALQTKALAYARLSIPRPDSMFTLLLAVKKMAQAQNELYNLADFYNNLGNFYGMLGNDDSSKYNYLKAIELGEEIGFNKVLSYSYGNIVHSIPTNTDLQKECWLRVMYNVIKMNEPDLLFFMQAFSQLAAIESDNDLAKDYFAKMEVLVNTISNPEIKAECYLMMGYGFQKEITKAYNYFNLAAGCAKQTDNLSLLGHIYHAMADAYLQINEFDISEKYHKKALGLFEKVDDTNGKASILRHLVNEYVSTKKYAKAIEVIETLLLSQFQEDDFQRFERYSMLVISYSNTGAFDKAEAALDTLNSILSSANLNFDYQNSWMFHFAKVEYNYYKGFFDKALVEIENILSKPGLGNTPDLLRKAYLIEKRNNNISKALEYHELLMAQIEGQNAEEDVKNIAKLEFREQMKIDSVANAEKAYQTELKYELKLSNDKRTKSVLLSSAIILLLLSGGLFLRWRTTKKAKGIIEHEKHIAEHERARSDELLLNILPAEVAEELKNTGTSEAKHFDEVSILFTDFKGFTQASEKLSPKDLVNEINTCFKAFDNICDKYGIEKIKTIGDSYMAASGLGHGSKDKVQSLKDASNLVSAALEMQHFMTTLNSRPDQFGVKPETRVPSNSGLNFQMRCGIHTGPVVAGIVGIKKFQYDIWGDTVNTASRMESYGEVGRVNISDKTYQLLKNDPEFTFEERDPLDIKGKGLMRAYFVNLNKGHGDYTKI